MVNICWLSPLDPVKTEIGRYSQAILPQLQEALSLGLVSDAMGQSEEYHCEKHVRCMEPVNIYNLGNSYMHCGILRLAMQKPGVVILHDLNLLELGLAYAREDHTFSLRDTVVQDHGFYAGKAFDDIYADKTLNEIYSGIGYEWCGQSQEQYDFLTTEYPLFKTFISNAIGIIVHSDFALQAVKKHYAGPVIKLNLPFKVTRHDVPVRHQASQCKIVFCGHAGPNRRLRQFIDAWADVSNPNFFRLSLYGYIDKADELMALAENSGLRELIDVVGFVDEETLDEALSAAHLALNLRNPTMGEASASQLRYWSRAVPSMVSDIGWYGELPHNVAIKVSPDNEKRDIIAALENIISGNWAFLDSGMNGFHYLCGEHSVQRYVADLAQFVEAVAWQRFVGAVFDDRMINVMESMCASIDDADLFENTMSKVSAMIAGARTEEFGKQ